MSICRPRAIVARASGGLLLAWATTATAGDADVVSAVARRGGPGSFDFDVTVRSADTGWDRYADRIEVLGPDGTILGARAGSPSRRRAAVHAGRDSGPDSARDTDRGGASAFQADRLRRFRRNGDTRSALNRPSLHSCLGHLLAPRLVPGSFSSSGWRTSDAQVHDVRPGIPFARSPRAS